MAIRVISIEKSGSRFLVEFPAAFEADQVVAFRYHLGKLLTLGAVKRE